MEKNSINKPSLLEFSHSKSVHTHTQQNSSFYDGRLRGRYTIFRVKKKTHIIKEVCILRMSENARPMTMVFYPPFAWESLSRADKRCNRWLSKYFHGPRWDSGDIPYDRLHNVLQCVLSSTKRIFVKGVNKAEQMKEILPEK